MAKWCNYFNCFCNDVEEVVPEEGIECDIDCKHCEYIEELLPRE